MAFKTSVISSITITGAVIIILVLTTIVGSKYASFTNVVAGQLAETDTNVTTSTANDTRPINVSIVPGAAALGDKAFSPNPVNIKVGDMITWTNDDDSDPAFHTVTSGIGPDDENNGQEFDSGLTGDTALITTGTTFTHTFDATGEFPYFCQLHPTMVGKVVVTS